MVRVIALTQFVFVTLGTMALMILMKTPDSHGGPSAELRLILSRYGLWLLLVPFVWWLIGELVQRATASPAVRNGLQASGILIAAVILAMYGWLILSF